MFISRIGVWGKMSFWRDGRGRFILQIQVTDNLCRRLGDIDFSQVALRQIPLISGRHIK